MKWLYQDEKMPVEDNTEVDYLAIEKKAKMMNDMEGVYLSSVSEAMSEVQKINLEKWAKDISDVAKEMFQRRNIK